MKIIRVLRPAIFLVSLSLVFSVSDSPPPLSGNSGDDPVPNVEVFSARGVLKVHGRNETQYRDMAPGSQSLASGSFLKTAGGSADILLPGDSVLSLEANTEVQLGMYSNGILIAHWSGRAFHHVENREGSTYAVQTPFFTAVATGTDFYTFVDWPVQGAVSQIYGDLMVKPRVVRDRNGNVLGVDAREVDVVGVVPAGDTCLIFPYDLSDAERLKEGDYYTFRLNQPSQTGKKTAHPPDDAWVQRNRNLSRMIEALRRARRANRLTPGQYRQKMGALLGASPEVVPNEPLRVQGSLWVGMDAYSQVIKFCVTGNQIDMVSYTGWIYCTDKKTHETYNYRVDFDLNEGVPFLLERNGSYIGGYEFPDGVYKGLTFLLNGFLSGSSGEAIISMFSENEVAVCNMGPTVIQLTRSPAPCVR